MGTTANVLVGPASSVTIAAYVASNGAGTHADVGFTNGGVTIDPKTELHMVEVDQKLGQLAALPKKREYELKIPFSEATLENLRLILAQPTANITGTAPNQTLIVDASAVAQYYQIKLITAGLGTNSTRTVTCWRAFVKDMDSWTFKKDANQMPAATFGLLEDTTSATTQGSILKAVDS